MIICGNVCPTETLQCVFIHIYIRSRNNQKGKDFETVQDIEASTAKDLKTLMKEDTRTASGRGKNDGMSVFEATGMDGNVSFMVIIKKFLIQKFIF